jgi:hypothetical protein
MSSEIGDCYCTEIAEHFKIYFATWLPGEPVQLGDYGELNGDIFSRLGNISKFNIVTTYVSGNPAHYKFASSNGVEVREIIGASANAPGVNTGAGLEVNFKRSNGIFFNIANGVVRKITDISEVEKRLITLLKKGIWNRERL